MNCKKGDLAYVVGPCPTPGLSGRFVVVERRRAGAEIFISVEGQLARLDGDEPCWVCRPASGQTLPWVCIGGLWDGKVFEFEERPIADSALRPIRDTDDEDEMLRIVGKPEPIGAAS